MQSVISDDDHPADSGDTPQNAFRNDLLGPPRRFCYCIRDIGQLDTFLVEHSQLTAFYVKVVAEALRKTPPRQK